MGHTLRVLVLKQRLYLQLKIGRPATETFLDQMKHLHISIVYTSSQNTKTLKCQAHMLMHSTPKHFPSVSNRKKKPQKKSVHHILFHQ